ncbi:S-layer homology domain-containing protein [Rothia nasimurium]|uniref:S-layer homology domain-containing protein n=1 Tax=Rothia nasimurium TaxID=85336 RepID=UPI001F412F24|nr:S-layer homology domain-containing protein [Rothia nasimurium]
MELNRRHLMTLGAAGAGALALGNGLVTPAVAGTYFEDVPNSLPFATEINWLYQKDIVTGTQIGWRRYYYPHQTVKRDAMAAFLYRVAGSPNYIPPVNSPFRDIHPGMQFYKEMCWLNYARISTGWPDRTFRPWDNVRRDAMAAFLYRLAGSPSFTMPSRSPFTDINPRTQFYKEMCWLSATGLSTGWADRTFRPWDAVRRDAMAAFLYRYMNSTSLSWPRSLVRSDMKKQLDGWDIEPTTSGAGIFFPNALTTIGYIGGEEYFHEIYVPQGARSFTFTLGLLNKGDSNRVHRTRILVNNKQVQSYEVRYFDKRKVKVNLPAGSSLITLTNMPISGKPTNLWGDFYITYGNPQFWG